MKHRMVALVALALLGSACDEPSYVSEQGQLGLAMDDLASGQLDKGKDSIDALAGSRMCPRFDGWFERDDASTLYHVRDDDREDDGWLRSCFATGASGVARVDGECLVLDGAGSAALELSPRACAVQDEADVTFTADRLPIESWSLADVELRYDDLVRVLYESAIGGPTVSLPADLRQDPAVPMRVIAGSPLFTSLQPFAKSDPLRAIGYSGGVPRIVGEGVRPELQTQLEEGFSTLVAGERFAIAMAVPGGELLGGELLGVDASEATSLELFVGYERCDGCELGWGPAGLAQAIVRDAEGRRLWAAEVEFDGDDELLDGGSPVSDALLLYPPCAGDEDAGELIRGTIVASYRELTASADVEYRCPEVVDPDEPEVVHDDAGGRDTDDDDLELFGCACDVGTRQPGADALGVLGLVVLALRRRRRA